MPRKPGESLPESIEELNGLTKAAVLFVALDSAIAAAMLKHLPRHAARVIEKVLRSAVANAEQKELGDSESMRVSKAFVNCGPIYNRFRARSMGRANAIQKRTSHITVVVEARGVEEKSRART